VRLREIYKRAVRHDPGRIDRCVTFIIVAFYVSEIDRTAHIGPLIQIARVGKKIRVLGQLSQVALEMSDVNRIKAHQRRKQPPIRFCYSRAAQKSLTIQKRFKFGKGFKERNNRLFVGGLRSREAGPINPIVDVRIDVAVDPIDIRSQILGGNSLLFAHLPDQRLNSSCE
jgi:hypothetical protein